MPRIGWGIRNLRTAVIPPIEVVEAAPPVKKLTRKCYLDKNYHYDEDLKKNVHPESKMAHEYLDGLCGVEIGAAAYAPFGLKTINVGLSEEMDPNDYNKYKNHQISVTGDYARIDVPGNAMNLINITDASVDFVITSHVWEHMDNPLLDLVEWSRKVKLGGFLFIMIPNRVAYPPDRVRPLTNIEQIKRKYNHPNSTTIADGMPPDSREHWVVWSTSVVTQAVHYFNSVNPSRLFLDMVAYREIDDKIQLGPQIVLRVLSKKPE